MSCPFWLNLKLHTLKKNNKINSKQHSFLVVFVPNSLSVPPPLSARLKTNIALLIGYNVEDYVFSVFTPDKTGSLQVHAATKHERLFA